MTYKQLRTEFNRPLFKRRLIEVLGSDCANCGSTESIEYHHIVPLALGGTNRITNIVPLCYKCHQKAHGSECIRNTFKSYNAGRNKKPPVDGYASIISDYLHGIIGRKECEERLELSPGNKLTDKWYFKDYIINHGISSHKNKIVKKIVLAKEDFTSDTRITDWAIGKLKKSTCRQAKLGNYALRSMQGKGRIS